MRVGYNDYNDCDDVLPQINTKYDIFVVLSTTGCSTHNITQNNRIDRSNPVQILWVFREIMGFYYGFYGLKTNNSKCGGEDD